MQEEKSVLDTLKIGLIVSILLHILTSVFSVGYHHGDEHYQLLEFAGLKLGVNCQYDMAWEYDCYMRPGLQPFVAFVFIKIFNFYPS